MILPFGVALLSLTAVRGAYTNRKFWRTTNDFLEAFDFDDSPDPSGGTVQYVNQQTAANLGLYGAGRNGGFRFGADSSQTGTRKSVRLQSKGTYGNGIYIFDVSHGPSGCGTWPALWTTTAGGNWPHGGEIDVMEQVNGVGRPDSSTLHTSPGCTMPEGRSMTGTATLNDCNVLNGANGNAGCGVNLFSDPNSFGEPLNNNGGGTYAMQRESGGIYVWFWQGNSAPFDPRSPNAHIDPASWGTPHASFPSTSCDVGQYFDAHWITMNIDFCGGFVDAFWQQDGCSKYGSCVDYVANNPGAFREAYFDLNAVSFWSQ
ncbi:hypothetical protein BDZ90DRAFT_226469 [Jaminaea rosea]|uniref:GH16 domain-containing protein n=1 Tax=Jaminaea rosea TaxID=1569628 RepID=A0A316UU34_9BASI|nr:hypothetical protein BDZ90DRAFT_226469 [Jaminaea rosea]PWN28308.1 hypothetical protein BDZ90DRAFT_226469 [Jaminaea rosea]